MSISSLSLLLTEGLEVGGGDTAGLVGVKAGIPNGSTLDWEGPGEENGLADTAKEITVECNIYTYLQQIDIYSTVIFIPHDYITCCRPDG